MQDTQITQKRYSLKGAFEQVPSGKLKDTRDKVSKILGLKKVNQLWYYTSGKSQPNLSQAKSVEEFFKNNFGITEVWSEI